MPSGIAPIGLVGGPEEEQPGLVRADHPLRLADHDRLGAGAADEAVQLAVER